MTRKKENEIFTISLKNTHLVSPPRICLNITGALKALYLITKLQALQHAQAPSQNLQDLMIKLQIVNVQFDMTMIRCLC